MRKLFRAPVFMMAFIALFIMTGQACAVDGYKDISPKEVKKMLDENASNILLLDVRTPGEYKDEGHLKGSVLIPISDIEARIGEIESYKDKEVIVYCRSGGRSSKVSNLLTGKGFKKIFNMSGGIGAWKSNGYAVE